MAIDQPRGGTHYPRSVGEFRTWFGSDEDCLDYLEWLRWPTGFACLACDHRGAWRLGDGRLMCAGCGSRTSVTAGTIFDRIRTPLTVWFTACWLFGTGQDGISALSPKRTLEIGSYQTAWTMLHRLRAVLVRPGQERLAGRVEMDETYIGGEEPGLRGGRAQGKKVLTGVAVEVREPKGMGRSRIAPLADASSDSLHRFVTDHVEPGATVITDGWQGYSGLDKLGYVHDRRTWPATSTSSCSVSTGAGRGAAGWCSFVCSNSPSPTRPCVTSISSPSGDRAKSRQGRRGRADTRQVWSGRQRIARGELLRRITPVKWIPQ